jgi:hypothetical protein
LIEEGDSLSQTRQTFYFWSLTIILSILLSFGWVLNELRHTNRSDGTWCTLHIDSMPTACYVSIEQTSGFFVSRYTTRVYTQPPTLAAGMVLDFPEEWDELIVEPGDGLGNELFIVRRQNNQQYSVSRIDPFYSPSTPGQVGIMIANGNPWLVVSDGTDRWPGIGTTILWNAAIANFAIYSSIIFVLIAGGTFLLIRCWRIVMRLNDPNQCHSCGYNIRAIDSRRCPECGSHLWSRNA